MSVAEHNMIVCQFDANGGQWLAYFESTPQVAFSADLPMPAVRRLLEGTESAAGSYPLLCDANQARTEVLRRDLIWNPLYILFTCESCRGTGQYTGLSRIGVCKVCGGRKVVPA